MSNKPSQRLMRGIKSVGDKEAAKAAFTNSEEFRKIAVAFLQDKWNKAHKDSISNLTYELPAYSEYQADCNGTLRTIEEILKEVFNIEDKEDA